MAKKHKPKGNQQKPHKRKSFRDQSTRESSGPPTPYFSLRDEVLNTERHNHDWSSMAKLRHMPVAFVSAGTTQPLDEPKKEPKVDEDMSASASGQVTPAGQDVEKELAQNEGAMADLNIDNSQDVSPEPYINVVVDAQEIVAAAPAPAHSTDVMDQDVQDDLFIVDSVGDQSLRPNGPAPIIREASPVMQSDSEDDVILFRGRREQITVRDDSLLVEPTETRPVMPSVSDTSPSAAPQKPKSKTTGRRKPGRHLMARKNQPRYDDEDGDDIDPAILQDYMDNMSGGEELVAAAFGKTNAEDEDEWTSSEMEDVDDEEDVDMSHDAAFEAALKSIAFDTEGDEEDEDEADFDDEDGTSDPGDDSELESDLEYTERERWEDEEDIRQRQIDSLTDEEIARILAKQEDLGMGSDEILLLDDAVFNDDISHAQAGLDAILANPNHPLNPARRIKKKTPRHSDHFPSASLMADVIEQDPYGGFDVMDFSRPSLRPTRSKKGRRSAGPMPEELGLSDSDLVEELQSSWAADRRKKAEKKSERESLRAAGMLGKKNKFKPDLATKFNEGMSMANLRDEIEDLLSNPRNSSKSFPPMEKRERKILHEIAHVFELTSVSRGSGKSRFTVLTKRQRTPDWFSDERWEKAVRIADRSYLRGAGKGKSGVVASKAGRGGGVGTAASYANGEVVGAAAPEIAATSFGHKLLLKMGWEKGMALGKDGDGRLTPVEARVKSGRGGLG